MSLPFLVREIPVTVQFDSVEETGELVVIQIDIEEFANF